MRKSFLGYLVLTLLLLVPPLLSACGPQGGAPQVQPTAAPTAEPTPATLPLTTYDDPAGFFSIDYPSSWKVTEAEKQVRFDAASGKLSIMVQYADAGQVVDAAGMRQIIDDYFTQTGGAVEGFKREKDTAQDDGSILVEYSFTTDGVPGYGGTFFEQRGTFLYILSFWVTDRDLWDANQPTLNAVANSFQPTPSGDWLTLTSTAGEYEIPYPPDWQARESNGAAVLSKDEETFLSIMVTTTLPAADPAEAGRLLVENMLTQLRRDDPNISVQGPDTLVFGGEAAYYADFTYVDPKTSLDNQGTVIGVVYHGRGYQVILFSLSRDAAANAPTFTQMLLSFRFVP